MSADGGPAAGQLLEWPGAFRLRVPAGWDATGVEGHRYTLRCGDVDATIDLSVHRVPDAGADGGSAARPDAREVVLAHARSAGQDARVLPLHGDESPTESRAGARWDVGGHGGVAAVVCTGRVVVLAAAVAADDASRVAVERVVTTLEPATPPARRWFGRRRSS